MVNRKVCTNKLWLIEATKQFYIKSVALQTPLSKTVGYPFDVRKTSRSKFIALTKLNQMHSVGFEPTTDNLEGCSSYPTELRMHVFTLPNCISQ